MKFCEKKNFTEAHYKCLVDYNPHLVLSADLKGEIVSINPKAMEILHVHQDAPLTSLYDLFYEHDDEKIDECLRKVEKGQSCFFKASVKTSREERVIMEFTFIPIVEEKDVIGLFVVGKDITELIKYQERIKKVQRDLWNAMCQQQGMIFKFVKRGESFIHTLCGGELLNNFGIDPKQVLGKRLHDFLPGPIADQKEQYYRYTWETGETLYYEGNINGIDYLVSLRPIKKDGKVIEVVGSAIDITERKMMEQEMLRAKEEAERANQAKSNLISRMSHEIRTPLNGVLGFAQLLEMDPSLNGRQREFVQEILGGARHLLNLINEMLDLARIETGRLPLTYDVVHPDDIIKESIKLVEPLANKKNIDIQARSSFSEQVYLYTDATRVRQVLLNLLDNAIKYNRDGGTVLIEGKYDQEKVVIHVKDNGIGIPDEEQENIFEPFYRIKGTHVDGNGIGLAFVKQIIRLLGGTIEVKSKLGVGSDFSFSLPAVSYFHGWPHSSRNKPVNQERLLKLGNKKILYIEDHISNVKLLEHILKPFPNLLLTFACNGGEGLQKAISGWFDLILIDIHLPDISGYTVLEMLQSDERTKHIPMIALSANAVPKEIERALKAGFTDYMTKPLEVNVFLEKLIHIWEEKRPHK